MLQCLEKLQGLFEVLESSSVWPSSAGVPVVSSSALIANMPPIHSYLDSFFFQLKIFKKKSKTQSNKDKAEPVKPAGTIRQSRNPKQLLQEEPKITLVSMVN